MKINKKIAGGVVALLLVSAIAAPQIKEVIKIVGVGAAVERFGPDINKAVNKVSGHKDSYSMTTKTVPIISVGRGRGAIGAAQVMGTKDRVDQVKAVAQIEGEFLGEFRIRALIPVSTKDVVRDVRRVEGVGVSGILDLKL
jgi:hypothetical protein